MKCVRSLRAIYRTYKETLVYCRCIKCINSVFAGKYDLQPSSIRLLESKIEQEPPLTDRMLTLLVHQVMYDELDFSTSTGVVPDENINTVVDLILKYYDMPRDQALSIAKPSGFIKLSPWDEKIKPKGDEKLFRAEFAITRIVEAYGQEITRKDIQHLVFLLKSFELGPQCLEGIYYELLDHGPFSSYVAATIDSAVTLGLLNEDHIGSNWYYTPTNMHNSKEFNQYKPLSNVTIETIQYLKKYDLCLVSSVRFFQCENEGELDEDIIQYLNYNLGFGDSGYEYLRFSKEVLRDVKYEIT